MDWIEDSASYKYLKHFSSQIDPSSEKELEFKSALEWALKTLEEQGQVLLNIETAQNSDITIPPPPLPHLTLIQGGKADDSIKRRSSQCKEDCST